MIIAVSGASGSIAKELIAFLEPHGHKIIRISSTIPRDGKLFFSFEDLKNQSIDCSVDIFIHLASINAKLDKSRIKEEVKLSEDTLAAMHSLNCKKLIFFSSAKVYGENTLSKNNIFNEDSLLKPTCAYGSAKKLCEELIISKSAELKINTMTLRLTPIITKLSNSNLGKLLKIVKKGIPVLSLKIGDANERSFSSINNINTVIAAILIKEDFPRMNCTYNLADDQTISINRLLTIFGSIFHNRKLIFILPAPLSSLISKLPYIQKFLIKLYGNFVIDNSKLKQDMGVKLDTTSTSLPIIYK